MVKDFFKKFVKSLLNTPQYVVVRKFIYGIFFDQEVNSILSKDLHQGDDDLQAKIEILRENVRSQLSNPPDHYGDLIGDDVDDLIHSIDLLELFISLSEAKDGISDIIKSSLDRVSFYVLPLSSSDVFTIGSVVSQCDRLDSLVMENCSLDASSLNVLDSQLKESKVELKMFILDGNVNLRIDGISAIGGIITQTGVEELDLSRCRLSAAQLQILADSTKNATKLRCLVLLQNENMGIDGISAVGRIVTRNDVEKLYLSSCHLSAEQLQTLADLTKDATKLQVVDLGEWLTYSHKEHRMKFEHEKVRAVGSLLSNVTAEVRLCNCKISYEDVACLQNELDKLGKEGLRVQIGKCHEDKYLSAKSKVKVASNVLYPAAPLVTQKEDQDVKAEDLKPSASENTSEDLKEDEGARISDDGEIMMLPQVEEAIARQDNESIMMTWKQIPIDRVSYWVQVYCNEKRTGDLFTTRDSKHRLEYPEPGSRYTFIVWAERDGIQSEHRTLSRNFLMIHLAGEEDSEMEMNGCRVKFPRGTFKEKTRVWMSVESGYFSCPEEHFPITPVMDIDPKSQLHQYATVQMRFCCVGLDKSMVDILHCENLAGMEWTSIAPQSCVRDGLIEFQCREFSPWLITFIRRLFSRRAVKFVVNIWLYVKHDQFRFVIFKNSGNERNIVQVAMDGSGARQAETYEQCVVRRGDKLTINPWVNGEPDSPKFTSVDDDSVILDSNNLEKDYISIRFQLQETSPVTDKDRSLFIRCHISLNGKVVDKGGRFRYSLKPLPSVPKPDDDDDKRNAKTQQTQERPRPTTGASFLESKGPVTIKDCNINLMAGNAGTQSVNSAEPKKEIEEPASKP